MSIRKKFEQQLAGQLCNPSFVRVSKKLGTTYLFLTVDLILCLLFTYDTSEFDAN
jgi:hypothetical protein